MTIARQRLDRLRELAADAAAAGEIERSRAYVRRARRVAERHRMTLPQPFRRRICDGCDRYLRPGEDARVRLRDGHVVVTCECGDQQRVPYR